MAFAKFEENRFRIDGEIAENHAILVNLTASIGMLQSPHFTTSYSPHFSVARFRSFLRDTSFFLAYLTSLSMSDCLEIYTRHTIRLRHHSLVPIFPIKSN